MRHSWPLAASALALLCLLALTPSGSRAENAICASLTPTHPAWGIYGCGAADSQQQEQVLDGITELQTKLDALDTKLSGVGADVDDLNSLAQMIASNLAALDTEVETTSVIVLRDFDEDEMASGEVESVMTAPPGKVLLTTCRFDIDGDSGTSISVEARLDDPTYQVIAIASGNNTTRVNLTTLLKRLRFRNSGVNTADDGGYAARCTAIEIPST